MARAKRTILKVFNLQSTILSPLSCFAVHMQANEALPHALRPLSGLQARSFADTPYSHVPPGRNHLAVPGEQKQACGSQVITYLEKVGFPDVAFVIDRAIISPEQWHSTCSNYGTLLCGADAC